MFRPKAIMSLPKMMEMITLKQRAQMTPKAEVGQKERKGKGNILI